MATRSTIAIENADGTVTGIYCHWDGYLAYNGKILQENYADEARVRELIALGNISSLDVSIGTKHDFDNCPKGETNAYARDRGEREQEARTYDNWTRFINEEGQEYDYLFRPSTGKWQVNTYSGIYDLAEAFTKEEV